jgi:hypothetical protein
MPRPVVLTTATVALAAAGLLAAAIASGGATSKVYTYRAAMSAGAETPKPKAPAKARGVFTASVTESGSVRTITWKLTFSGLGGRAVAAHIHKGKAGKAGGVLVPLCGPCRSGQTGTLRITSAAGDALERALAYVNVHTAKNAGGEIRGQVKLTGEHDASASSTAKGETTTPPATTGGGGGGYGGYGGY